MATVFETKATQQQWGSFVRHLKSKEMTNALKQFYKGAQSFPQVVRGYKVDPTFGWQAYAPGTGNLRPITRVAINAMGRNICVAFEQGLIRVVVEGSQKIPTQLMSLLNRSGLTFAQVSAAGCPTLVAFSNTFSKLLHGLKAGVKGFMPLFIFDAQIRYMHKVLGTGPQGGPPDA